MSIKQGNITIAGAGASGDKLPSQTGKAGKFLTTNGTSPSWADVPSEGANKDLSNLSATGEAKFNAKQDVTDNTLTTTAKTIVGAINEVNANIPTKTSDLTNDSDFITSSYHDNTKQDINDNTLTTTDKTIVGAINEVNAKPSMPSLDEETITTNTDNELQAVGVIDEGNGYAYKFREVTQAQYDAMKEAGTLDPHTHYSTPQEGQLLSLLDQIWRVGDIYITTNATCPLEVLGIGTWQLVGVDRVLQGAGTRGSVGTTLNESLPNIKGTFSNTIWADTEAVATGALEVTVGDIANRPAASSGQAFRGFNLDASRISSTYQDNAPVQQDAYLVNIFRRIA